MMIQYGTIINFRYLKLGEGKKLEVKVRTDGRPTGWLPVRTQASSFLIEHTPVRLNDQVIVFNPFGDNEDGFVDRNITYKNVPLPEEVDENTFYKKLEDGTVYYHNTKTNVINLDTPCDLTLNVGGNIKIEAGGTIHINGSSIHLNS